MMQCIALLFFLVSINWVGVEKIILEWAGVV